MLTKIRGRGLIFNFHYATVPTVVGRNFWSEEWQVLDRWARKGL